MSFVYYVKIIIRTLIKDEIEIKEQKTGTLQCIGILREDEKKLYCDMRDFITDFSAGKKPVIKNSPVVPLKAEDFREILSKCWDMAQNGEDKFCGINKLIGLAEKCMV